MFLVTPSGRVALVHEVLDLHQQPDFSLDCVLYVVMDLVIAGAHADYGTAHQHDAVKDGRRKHHHARITPMHAGIICNSRSG